jgi:2-(1,2-epoxy-1,2-dihydrophenyl)acetyl-CoA isomerase
MPHARIAVGGATARKSGAAFSPDPRRVQVSIGRRLALSGIRREPVVKSSMARALRSIVFSGLADKPYEGAPMEQQLIEAISDGVATLTLNRPERLNALSAPIMDGLLEALPRLARDPAVGAIVITGAGRAFCAGGDVKRMAEDSVEPPMEEAVARLRGRMEVSRLLHEIPKPTIAMVNGPAAGAGLSIALACDLRIAGQSARFVTAFAKVGFSGDFGGSYFLSKLVGTGKARELYYTAEPLDAAQALALGVANRVVPDADLAATTMAFAGKLASGPRIALGLMKKNFNAAENGSLAELLDLEAQGQIATGRTADHKEAARAFVEKRVPVFVGR